MATAVVEIWNMAQSAPNHRKGIRVINAAAHIMALLAVSSNGQGDRVRVTLLSAFDGIVRLEETFWSEMIRAPRQSHNPLQARMKDPQ